MVSLGNEPVRSALLTRMLPAIGRRVGRARDLCDHGLAPKSLDDRARRVHAAGYFRFSEIKVKDFRIIEIARLSVYRKDGAMDIDEIKEKLAPHGAKRRFAQYMGWTESAVTSLLTDPNDGKPRNIKIGEIPKISQYFKLGRDRLIPVKGTVVGGGRIEWRDEPESGFTAAPLPAPPEATRLTVAIEVSGESLGDALNAWFLYFEDTRPPAPQVPTAESLYVLGLREGGDNLVRKIEPARVKGTFHLKTPPPLLADRRLAWASEVWAARPPRGVASREPQ